MLWLLQSIGYVLRYAGNILGSCLGTVVYNKKAWGWGLDISQVRCLFKSSHSSFLCLT